MTIRTKLTLWYAGVLFASLLLCGGLLYNEWVIEPARHHVRVEMEDLGAEGICDLAEGVLFAALPAAILGLGGGWLIMRKGLASVAAITKEAERINESNLSVQLYRSGNGDELDRLTAVFNSMILRLSGSFARIREFTLRASHELKTPLTIIRGQLETTLSRESISLEQRESLLDELEEIDRLAKIVDGLTLLTKADAGLIKLKEEALSLDELLRDTYADAQVLARPGGVQVHLMDCEKAAICGDNYRLRQALLNLVDNAVKYNSPGGSVTLALRWVDNQAEVTVSNTGPGISPEALPRIFDPFFRDDASQGRSIDGSGLGLSIARWIVMAHGGTLTVSSEPSRVTTATLRLPSST